MIQMELIFYFKVLVSLEVLGMFMHPRAPGRHKGLNTQNKVRLGGCLAIPGAGRHGLLYRVQQVPYDHIARALKSGRERLWP